MGALIRSNPENKTLTRIIAVIDARGPSILSGELGVILGTNQSGMHRALKRGINEGYLVELPGKCVAGTGRPQCAYSRTEKPYTPPVPSKEALRLRAQMERRKARDARELAEIQKQLEAQRNAAIFIRRHPFDVMFFGAYPKPFESHLQPGRVYRQPMDVEDDMEQAA